MSQPSILQLDIGGVPQNWLTAREASELIARDVVSWTAGDIVDIFRAGTGRDGNRTIIEIPSIIAVNGAAPFDIAHVPPTVTHEKIFRRDRYICAYCAGHFHPKDLEAEHIMPKSRGGEWSWMNIVASCHTCNQIKKRNMTPEEAGMPLVYLPYIPSRWEDMIMKGRHVLTDQMDFLMASVPKHSRLRPC